MSHPLDKLLDPERRAQCQAQSATPPPNARSADRIPPSYIAATWRTTLPLCDDGTLAFALNLPGGQVVRVRLDAEDAQFLRQTIDPAYWADPAIAVHDAAEDTAHDTAVQLEREQARHAPPY